MEYEIRCVIRPGTDRDAAPGARACARAVICQTIPSFFSDESLAAFATLKSERLYSSVSGVDLKDSWGEARTYSNCSQQPLDRGLKAHGVIAEAQFATAGSTSRSDSEVKW